MIVDLRESILAVGYDADLIDQFDSEFKAMAKRNLAAVNVVTPSVMDKQLLQQMGYLETFSGHVTKIEALETASSPEHEACLIPAACLPLYPVKEQVAPNSNTCLTSKVKVFRYEQGNRQRGIRAWEFNVREIVFIGTPSYVNQGLDEVEQYIRQFTKENNMPIKIDYSSDYFTGESDEVKMMKRIQRANQVKREVLWNEGELTVALASLNKHLDHFSKMFGWDEQGKCVSGCVGFGLERWLYAWKSLFSDKQIFPRQYAETGTRT